MMATPGLAYGSCPWARFYSSTVSPASRWTSRSLGREVAIDMKCLLCAVIWLCTFTIYAKLPALIPRETLFGNPERSHPEVSPDGAQIACLAPDQNELLNLWASAIDGNNPHPITHEPHRPITWYAWGGDSKHILYLQENAGAENQQLFSA